MRLWLAELRQRNVFKVATAYAISGWVLIQLGSLLFENFGTPAWVPKAFTVLIFLGFPVACLFAWALEITPEGVRVTPAGAEFQPRSSDWLWGGALVITMLVAVTNLAHNWKGVAVVEKPDATAASTPPGANAARKPAATATASEDRPSVAVLPFENFSGNPADEYFSEGLADTVLHQLAQIRDLKVIARNSSFQFKGKNLDVREIGTRLGVSTVLEGSVQRYGEQIRVIAQLVRTIDGSHAWSQSFDYKMADVFALQDAIAIAVANHLQKTLLPGETAGLHLGGTDNPQAYDLYLQAKAENEKAFSPTVADQADIDAYPPMRLLDQALALDPNYVDALVEQVTMYDDFAFLTTIDERSKLFIGKAEPLARRALELAPEYSAAWSAIGRVAHRSGKDREAIEAFTKAISLNPNDADAHAGLAIAGGFADPLATIEHMRIAHELDPGNKYNRPTQMALLRLGRTDEAVAALEIDAKDASGDKVRRQLAMNDLAVVELAIRGRPDASARWGAQLRTVAPDSIQAIIALGRAWWAAGDSDRASRWILPAAAQHADSDDLKVYRLRVHMVRGDMQAATAVLRSIKPIDGRGGLYRSVLEAQLCFATADIACAQAATVAFRNALGDMQAPDLKQGLRARQHLFEAVVASRQGASATAAAQAVVDATRGMPRTSYFDRTDYLDAEAFVLQGKLELALQALEESLLPNDGFIAFDSFGLPAERGVVLSKLKSDPRFEDWKTRYTARRDAARQRMLAMETAGEIPAPPAAAE